MSSPPLAIHLLTLERLLAISVSDLKSALTEASDLVAEALKADKVDSFVYDAQRDTLVAVGASRQPLSALQKRLGLDTLPVSNGGRTVEVYRTGRSFGSGRIDEDVEELRGVREGLKVRSEIGVAFEVSGVRRGVLMLASLERERWTEEDVRFAESVGRWVSSVLHQA